MKKKPLFTPACMAVLLFSGSSQLFAADSDMPEVQLDNVTVTDRFDTTTYLTQTDFERKTANTLWEAVRGVPGVFQGESAGRGENTITIRGSSRYQIGMYVDDIPVATAYRNEWSADNALLFDLESVDIAKGFSSPLLGSNNGLAGTINLKTAKPVKELDFKAKYTNYFDSHANDQGRLMGLSLGTRQEKFFSTVFQAISTADVIRTRAGGSIRTTATAASMRWSVSRRPVTSTSCSVMPSSDMNADNPSMRRLTRRESATAARNRAHGAGRPTTRTAIT